MEREIVMTGIGGQGVQLGAQILARAAVREQRHVMVLGTYGGTMRGGNTDSTIVVGDAPISAPPIVSRTWSAIAMHHAFWPRVGGRLRPHGIVLLNSSLFEGEVDRRAYRVFDVPATSIAAELGSPLAASMVIVAAFASLTGLVGVESLVAAMHESVPAYRRQHLDVNERALRAGFSTVSTNVVPAWLETARGESAS